MADDPRSPNAATYVSFGIIAGLLAGVVIGIVIDNLSIGIGIGTFLGVVASSIYIARLERKKDSGHE